jgi:hypothetical protein
MTSSLRCDAEGPRAIHEEHARLDILADWSPSRFVKVIPRDYKRVMRPRRWRLPRPAQDAATDNGVLAVANG